MTRVSLGIVFAVLLLVALVVTLPLGLVLPDRAIAARAATGTIWSGRLSDARAGRMPLGDLDVSVSPLALLTGTVRATLSGASGRGTVIGGRGIAHTTARLPAAALFAPVPLSEIDLDDVTAEFDGSRCAHTEGRVRATFSGEIAGLALAQGLSGIARCEGGMLLLPLVSQSAMERLNLRIAGDGGMRAEFIVRATDPALAARLAASGFQSTQAGYVLRLSGSL